MSPNLLEKASWARSWDPKVACMVTLTLVFLCGAAAGAVAMDFGLHNRLHQPSFDTPVGRELYFSRMQRELNLTPAQQEQMESTLNDSWQYYVHERQITLWGDQDEEDAEEDLITEEMLEDVKYLKREEYN